MGNCNWKLKKKKKKKLKYVIFKKKISLKEKKKKGLCIYIGCRERERGGWSPTSSRRRILIFPSVWGSANLTASVRSWASKTGLYDWPVIYVILTRNSSLALDGPYL